MVNNQSVWSLYIDIQELHVGIYVPLKMKQIGITNTHNINLIN